MCVFQLFLCADPSLGRVDYSSLSDQTLMEMLIECLDDETKAEYQDTDGLYLDVCDWSCTKCDDEERVIEISLESPQVSGSLELCYVPPNVKVIKARSMWNHSKLSGSADLTHLPEGIGGIDLRGNELTGEIDSTKLPEAMVELYLGQNQFTGKVDLTNLPGGIRGLYLDNNQLTGKIDLTQLPKGMHVLRLQYNQFTGEIDLTKLPEAMVELYLGYNQLTGEIDLTQLPGEVESLSLVNNQLTGEIDLTKLPGGIRGLFLNNNQFTGEIDLANIPHGMGYLFLENNQLSGSFVAKRLKSWISVNARRNQFNAVAVVKSETQAGIKLRGSGVTSVVNENGRELDVNLFL